MSFDVGSDDDGIVVGGVLGASVNIDNWSDVDGIVVGGVGGR